MSSATAFIHPMALCESDHIGPGTRVWAFAHIMRGAVVGADCNICGHAFVESGAVIGDRVTVKNNVMVWDKVTVEDDVFLGPGAVLTNDLRPRAASKNVVLLPTRIERGATVGAGVVIRCGVAIGEHAMIGAGTVVLHDVPDHALMVGNPARQIGWVCECGDKLPDSQICACGRRYSLEEVFDAASPDRSGARRTDAVAVGQ